MTNAQVNASRFVAVRNPDCTFAVGDGQITVSHGLNSQVVEFTTETPAETLKADLMAAATAVCS